MKKKNNRLQSCLFFIFIICLLGLIIGIFWLVRIVTNDVSMFYGEPDPSLGLYKTITLSTKLYFSGDDLLSYHDELAEDYYFEITPGETVGQISYRLSMLHLINDSEIFNNYLIFKGYDRIIQSGYFLITPGMNGIEIAEKLTNPVPDKVRFVILPGWRAEEIAAILPQSGLNISDSEFLELVKNPSSDWLPEALNKVNSLEGFLYPGDYLIGRDITNIELLQTFLNSFIDNVSPDVINAIEVKGLTLQQGITIASMVEREAIQISEMPQIASVFLNRYTIGMKFDSDPTVQYAVGYNVNQATWWTNPLSMQDLQIDSVFNTYIYNGIPPHPISNPSLSAIQAVAFPAETSYYYFRAKCDGSGFHNFSQTYEEHLDYACP